MKSIFVFIVSAFFLFFIIFILTLFLRAPISKGKILKPARLLVQFLCPPKDLFDMVIDEKIDIASKGEIPPFMFKIKYIGPYNVGILLNKFNDNWCRNKRSLQLRLKLDFYSNDILLISKESTDKYEPFYGRRGNGFILFSFDSPAEIPIDTYITCKAMVLIADKELDAQCGPARLYAQKLSEE